MNLTISIRDLCRDELPAGVILEEHQMTGRLDLLFFMVGRKVIKDAMHIIEFYHEGYIYCLSNRWINPDHVRPRKITDDFVMVFNEASDRSDQFGNYTISLKEYYKL